MKIEIIVYVFFTVRLTVRFDPLPPNDRLFVIFFAVCLTLDYDYMSSKMDFTRHFNQPTRITLPP